MDEIIPLTDEEVAEIEAAYAASSRTISPERDQRQRRWLQTLRDTMDLRSQVDQLKSDLEGIKEYVNWLEQENANLTDGERSLRVELDALIALLQDIYDEATSWPMRPLSREVGGRMAKELRTRRERER